MDEWVKPGTHINAIGADMPGKQELDPRIMARAKVVVDSLPQCVRIGEVQTAIREGIIREEDIYAEIGEIVAGKKRGRTSPDEVTVFDSTGMGIQDVSSAHSAYLKAKERGLGKPVEFF
jgi:ornithine cyclodeaminase/alanine dehydrogenase-like protein (mu-crystallin family)